MIISPEKINIINYINDIKNYHSLQNIIYFSPLISAFNNHKYDFLYGPIDCNRKFYLGTQEDLENIINGKLNNNISSFKKVFFDKSCNYPRYKLNEKTNIKRCLDYNKASSVIISKLNFESYHFKSYDNILNNKDNDKIRVYYSNNEDQYYFIDRLPYNYYNSKISFSITSIVKKYYSQCTIENIIKS